jgi:hypothetical protein
MELSMGLSFKYEASGAAVRPGAIAANSAMEAGAADWTAKVPQSLGKLATEMKIGVPRFNSPGILTLISIPV